MNARFRVVHFVPDPFLGGRVPIAALVEHEGRVSVAKVPHIPGPACLGGRDAAALVQMILADLDEVEHFDQLPTSLGPQAVLDRVLDVPRGIDDAVRWISSKLFAGVPVDPHDINEHYRGPRRSTFGYRFFQAYKVAKYVQKTFDPGVNANGFLPEAKGLGAISHYVEGDREVLLMEPVLPERATWEADTTEVARTFAAYQTALRQHGDRGRRAILTAYILEGGARDTREEIQRQLSKYAQVVDTSKDAQRADFISHITKTGRSGSAPELI